MGSDLGSNGSLPAITCQNAKESNRFHPRSGGLDALRVSFRWSVTPDIRKECQKIEDGHFESIASSGLSTKDFPELGRLIDRTNFRSIDALLATYTEFIEIGKLLIAVCLLPKENVDVLFSAKTLPSNWMVYVFERMEGERLVQFSLNRVTFVTFNYDRTLEFFLKRQLMNRYRATASEADDVLKAIPVIHVHGRLGSLEHVEYGKHDTRFIGGLAKRASSEINIIHEADGGSADFSKACLAIEQAEKVGLLGFGYHPLNMDRLKFEDTLRDKYVVGTCKGLTPPELKDMRSRIRGDTKYEAFLDGDCMHLLKHTELIH